MDYLTRQPGGTQWTIIVEGCVEHTLQTPVGDAPRADRFNVLKGVDCRRVRIATRLVAAIADRIAGHDRACCDGGWVVPEPRQYRCQAALERNSMPHPDSLFLICLLRRVASRPNSGRLVGRENDCPSSSCVSGDTAVQLLCCLFWFLPGSAFCPSHGAISGAVRRRSSASTVGTQRHNEEDSCALGSL